MGEIADAMLEGDLCEGCGEYIGEGSGYPRYCSKACAAGRGMTYTPPAVRSTVKARKAQRINAERQAAAGKDFACSHCARRFRSENAVKQHARDKHGATQ